jgi:hypothetical protein
LEGDLTNKDLEKIGKEPLRSGLYTEQMRCIRYNHETEYSLPLAIIYIARGDTNAGDSGICGEVTSWLISGD